MITTLRIQGIYVHELMTWVLLFIEDIGHYSISSTALVAVSMIVPYSLME